MGHAVSIEQYRCPSLGGLTREKRRLVASSHRPDDAMLPRQVWNPGDTRTRNGVHKSLGFRKHVAAMAGGGVAHTEEERGYR